MSKSLIIMAKAPAKGKSKTRLAGQVGEDKALALYELMLKETFAFSKIHNVHTTVYFVEKSNYSESFNLFPHDFQLKGDLGEKMLNAFEKEFSKGFEKVLIIGTDCPDNSSENINLAFDKLDNSDVVIGPSGDGGYYLLGMKSPFSFLFDNKKWSSEEVYSLTVLDIRNNGLEFFELPQIDDIDYYKDVIKSDFFIKLLKSNTIQL